MLHLLMRSFIHSFIHAFNKCWLSAACQRLWVVPEGEPSGGGDGLCPHGGRVSPPQREDELSSGHANAMRGRRDRMK